MVAVVDYNAGNVCSVLNALARLNVDAILTSDKEQIVSADRVIFPGVGAAKSAMEELKRRDLIDTLRSIKRPFLGICLGMQLMNSFSEEGDVDLLNIVDEKVLLFDKTKSYKIPHVGWNQVRSSHPLFDGIKENDYFYFVHSYYVNLGENSIATTDYCDITFSAAIGKSNFLGVQFHPEKSGKAGEKLLKNFLSWEV